MHGGPHMGPRHAIGGKIDVSLPPDLHQDPDR
jgi:hypothetical protein